jgi:hypothetical protein
MPFDAATTKREPLLSELLQSALGLIEHWNHWCQCDYVQYSSSVAGWKYCALGALSAASVSGPMRRSHDAVVNVVSHILNNRFDRTMLEVRAYRALCDAAEYLGYGNDPVRVNDFMDHGCVVAMYRRAIYAAVEGEVALDYEDFTSEMVPG